VGGGSRLSSFATLQISKRYSNNNSKVMKIIIVKGGFRCNRVQVPPLSGPSILPPPRLGSSLLASRLCAAASCVLRHFLPLCVASARSRDDTTVLRHRPTFSSSFLLPLASFLLPLASFLRPTCHLSFLADSFSPMICYDNFLRLVAGYLLLMPYLANKRYIWQMST
jgi:hypothetical protein